MDSDDENLSGATIFDARIDNIWKENMEIYKKEFIFDDDDEEKKEDEEVKKFKKDKETIKENEDKDSILDSKATELLRRIAAKRSGGRKKGNKRTATNMYSGDSNDVSRLSASAKKRIRELELETAREVRRVEEENKMVFDKCDNFRSKITSDMLETVEDTNREILIKIKYQFKVSKVKAREKEEFKSIFQKVAEMYGLKPTGFLLCLGDNNIKLNDTPSSLNMRICDILDCIPYDDEENMDNSHKLILKIQSNDTRKKTEITAHKLEKFIEVMKKYADLRKLPLERLTFEFDGELIQPDETPLDLDMESGSCIDVRVTNIKEPSKKNPSISDAKKIPPLPMEEIVFLD